MNNVNEKVLLFKKLSDLRLKKCGLVFKTPAQQSPDVQERMARIGVEARCLGALNVDEFYMIALASLQDDAVKHGGV